MVVNRVSGPSSKEARSWLPLCADVVFVASLCVVFLEQQLVWITSGGFFLRAIRVDWYDLIAVAMVALALIARVWTQVHGARRWILAVLLLIAAIGGLRWVQVAGLQHGFNHERPWIYAFAALLFGLACGPMRWQWWRKVLVVWGLVIAVFQAVALFALGWDHGYADSTLVHGDFYGTRPLLSPLALGMVLALVILASSASWPLWLRLIGGVFLGLSCIWCQDRSVWLALVASLVVCVLVTWRSSDRFAPAIIAGALLVVMAFATVLPLLTGFAVLPTNINALRASVITQKYLGRVSVPCPGTSRAVVSGASTQPSSGAGICTALVPESYTHLGGIPSTPAYQGSSVPRVVSGAGGSPLLSTGTFSWRLHVWKSRLAASRPASAWLVGEMFGPTILSQTDSPAMNVDLTSHSEPIEDIVRGGLIGIGCILVLFCMALSRRRKAPQDAWIFLWGLLVFGIVYVWPPWSWVCIGLVLADSSVVATAARNGSSRSRDSDTPAVLGLMRGPGT